jgi:ATP-dependent Clp protease ATP-binding subunit ClpC
VLEWQFHSRPIGPETLLLESRLSAIFDRLLTEIHIRALEHAGVSLIIRLGPKARNLVIARGTDLQFGARPLRRAVESALLDPLSRLIAAHRLTLGDVIEVECQDGQLVFYRSAAGQASGSTIVSG